MTVARFPVSPDLLPTGVYDVPGKLTPDEFMEWLQNIAGPGPRDELADAPIGFIKRCIDDQLAQLRP